MPEPLRSEIKSYTKEIIHPDEIDGIEDNPHVTVKWGLETSDIEEVAKAIGKFIPIRIMFGAQKCFGASDERPTDVGVGLAWERA